MPLPRTRIDTSGTAPVYTRNFGALSIPRQGARVKLAPLPPGGMQGTPRSICTRAGGVRADRRRIWPRIGRIDTNFAQIHHLIVFIVLQGLLPSRRALRRRHARHTLSLARHRGPRRRPQTSAEPSLALQGPLRPPY